MKSVQPSFIAFAGIIAAVVVYALIVKIQAPKPILCCAWASQVTDTCCTRDEADAIEAAQRRADIGQVEADNAAAWAKADQARLWNHVNMAQNNRPPKSTSRALCIQAHGAVIEVDGLFTECVGGE